MTVADDLFAAIEKGDVEAIKGLYAPDAVIWHNNDEIEQDVTQNVRVLAWMAANFSERSYEDVRRSEFDGGFVQQHVLKLTKLDGTKVELPACIVASTADGKITRIDEYLDSAHIARITG